ncbi:DNA-binding response regulator, NarL/FixJ family, contains REC and HTH domains [Amycolatopsis lurida]|uniref:LuxR family transcriptional regulator n=1 Tax=Amycolatopsis lurida NRRL 2430 TaxID=1460371 RepID=A0A2P2FZI6_AMYLU|nr:response regulator transcription factor [Amycolatopsis lurida]KFU82132.1 LuxR family transcriptional regulator [Amycolatopsis lurida NRRL 2430]SEC46883.1 DNA-binding response regulator, NarL/FixJ family, contains REC and HTH domains [Amycolatopsis lurida]
MFPPLRVLVVDDHPAFRTAICALLDGTDGVEVVGQAPDGLTAVAEAGRAEPDVVLMDLNLPDLDGVEATRRIVSACPHTGVLMLTMFESEAAVFAAMRAGARGYLLKGARNEQVVRAVRVIGDGEAIFSPAIANRVLSLLGTETPRDESFPRLTAREREIMGLIAQGMGNASIADRLVLSPKTVRNHVSHIFRKLHVTDRAQAIAKVRKTGVARSE